MAVDDGCRRGYSGSWRAGWVYGSSTRSLHLSASGEVMAFEEVCRRCGRCCASKVLIGEEVHYTPFSCRYLDMKTHLCTVYDRRHEINPECLSLEEGILLGVFPADCPYVQDRPHYRPPREEHTSVRSLFALLKQVDEDPSRHSGERG